MKKFGFPLLVVAVAGAMIGIFYYGNAKSDPANGVKAIKDLKTFDKMDQGHTTEAVTYDQSPPVGGKHDLVWSACDGQVYDEPLRNENAVHSLEHGAAWVTYKDLEADDIEELARKVEGQDYTLMSPYSSQSAKVVLSAWGNQLQLGKVDAKRIDQFLAAFRQGTQAPEAGASCKGAAAPLPGPATAPQ